MIYKVCGSNKTPPWSCGFHDPFNPKLYSNRCKLGWTIPTNMHIKILFKTEWIQYILIWRNIKSCTYWMFPQRESSHWKCPQTDHQKISYQRICAQFATKKIRLSDILFLAITHFTCTVSIDGVDVIVHAPCVDIKYISNHYTLPLLLNLP